MRRPLKRHNLILLLGLLLYHSSFLTWATEVPTEKSGYKTENPEKREFTLQDLLNSQQTISSTSSSATAIKPIDLTALLAGSTQTQTQPSIIAAGHPKPTDIELSPDKYGRYNLDGAVANFLAKQQSTSSGGLQIEQPKPAISINDLQSLLQGHQVQLPKPDVAAASIESAPNVFHEELELGKQKLEIDSAGKRNVHYTVAKGADGQLSLVPVVDGSPQNGVEGLELLQAKEGISAKGQSRQQMQLTTLSQAMYSPFSSDMNSLHLHLKGKDGKDGKPGNKGPMGPLGPLGPAGPKGSKGDAGTCSNQINGLYECTPDELDSLSNRVDYLEKICRKVQNAKKRGELKIEEENEKKKAEEVLEKEKEIEEEKEKSNQERTKKEQELEKKEEELRLKEEELKKQEERLQQQKAEISKNEAEVLKPKTNQTENATQRSTMDEVKMKLKMAEIKLLERISKLQGAKRSDVKKLF